MTTDKTSIQTERPPESLDFENDVFSLAITSPEQAEDSRSQTMVRNSQEDTLADLAPDERAHLEGIDDSDNDQDMSDGGAALDYPSPHAEQLNAELDLLDADIMGPENLAELYTPQQLEDPTTNTFNPNILPPAGTHQEPVSPPDPLFIVDNIMVNVVIFDIPHAPPNPSQQLQHLPHQDTQEHDYDLEEVEEQHAANILAHDHIHQRT